MSQELCICARQMRRVASMVGVGLLTASRVCAQGSEAHMPSIWWLGLDIDSQRTRLEGSSLEIEVHGNGSDSRRGLAVIRALADQGGNLRLYVIPPTRGVDRPGSLLRALAEGIDKRATGIVMQASNEMILRRARTTKLLSSDGQRLISLAWNRGSLLMSSGGAVVPQVPVGFLLVNAVDCATTTHSSGRSALAFCSSGGDPLRIPQAGGATAGGGALSPSDRALVLAAAATASCRVSPGREALDRAVCVLAASRRAAEGLLEVGAVPSRVAFCGEEYPWDQRVADLKRPLDRKAVLGPGSDPALQIQLLLNKEVYVRELAALEAILGISAYYVYPYERSIAIFRFQAGVTSTERRLALDLLRSLRGAGSGELFDAVAADTTIEIQ